MKNNHMEEKIEKILETIRPALQMDGGDVRFVSYNEETGAVHVELLGHCAHCPMSTITLKQGIEAELKKSLPEITSVKAV